MSNPLEIRNPNLRDAKVSLTSFPADYYDLSILNFGVDSLFENSTSKLHVDVNWSDSGFTLDSESDSIMKNPEHCTPIVGNLDLKLFNDNQNILHETDEQDDMDMNETLVQADVSFNFHQEEMFYQEPLFCMNRNFDNDSNLRHDWIVNDLNSSMLYDTSQMNSDIICLDSISPRRECFPESQFPPIFQTHVSDERRPSQISMTNSAFSMASSNCDYEENCPINIDHDIWDYANATAQNSFMDLVSNNNTPITY
jgi:hypothetical protein